MKGKPNDKSKPSNKKEDPNQVRKLQHFYELERKVALNMVKNFGSTADSHLILNEEMAKVREEHFFKHFPMPINMEIPRNDDNTDEGLNFDFLTGNGWGSEDEDDKMNNFFENINNTIKKDMHIRFPLQTGDYIPEIKQGVDSPSKIIEVEVVNGKKLYKCAVDGCDKKYTSTFGLKYHTNTGHCPEKSTINRPFSCPYENCKRMYKNNNGLKYHIKHFHQEGNSKADNNYF